MEKRIVICDHCGTQDVNADAVARWNVDAQDYELSSVHDNHTCEEEDGECTAIEVLEDQWSEMRFDFGGNSYVMRAFNATSSTIFGMTDFRAHLNRLPSTTTAWQSEEINHADNFPTLEEAKKAGLQFMLDMMNAKTEVEK